MLRNLALVMMITAAPLALAVDVPIVCGELPGGTCAGAFPVVDASTVGTGQTAVFDKAAYVIAGLIVVQDGGIMLVRDTTFDFDGDDAGILVESGGVLDVQRTTMGSAAGAAGAQDAFEVVAEAGSDLTLFRTLVTGGTVRVLTSDPDLSILTIESTPLALELGDVDATLQQIFIRDAATGMSIHGGSPEITQSSVDGPVGSLCIDVSDATFDLTDSDLIGCHFGVRATDSTSTLSMNSMRDREDPLSVGFELVGGSALATGNMFEDWGIGFLVTSGSLDQHDNTFVNVGEPVQTA